MSRQDLPLDWVQRYVDGDLEGPVRAEAEARLANDPARAAEAERLRAENAALRASLPEPDARHLAALADKARASAHDGRAPLRVAAMAALFAFGLGTGWFGATQMNARGAVEFAASGEPLVAAAAAAHQLYSVEVLHPVEVTGDRKAHLDTWLSNRLGGPISAPDLDGAGYRLVGGRLLPGGAGPAAQFMYEEAGGQRITLYVAADAAAPNGLRFEAKHDLSAVTWTDGTWRYALIGALGRDEMEALARQMHGDLI